MFSLGYSDPQYSRLERAVLLDDRCALLELRRIVGKNGMGQVWRCEWGSARQPLRKLHGALRLRTDGDVGPASAARRHLEDGQIQLWCQAQPGWPWQCRAGVSRRPLLKPPHYR